MTRISSSPMSVQGGISPMSTSFQSYPADRSSIQRPATDASIANDTPPAHVEPAGDNRPPDIQTTTDAPSEGGVDPDQLDQMADVTYELDPSGQVIPDTVTRTQADDGPDVTDGDTPAPRKRTKAKRNTKK